MTFNLPNWTLNVSPNKWTVHGMNAAVQPEGVLGGPDQRFTRQGSRFSVDVGLPPMNYPDARLWTAALIRSMDEEVIMGWLQPGFDGTYLDGVSVGAVTSAGGNTLALAGLSPSAYVEAGQFFNINKGGRAYLHMCVQTGNTPIVIGPRTRIDVAAGDALTFDGVVIQGFVSGNDLPFDVDVAHQYGVRFTVKERM